jgi:hypothetical protein
MPGEAGMGWEVDRAGPAGLSPLLRNLPLILAVKGFVLFFCGARD